MTKPMINHARSIQHPLAFTLSALAVWGAIGTSSAYAGIATVEMARRNQLTQIGDGTVTPNGSYLNFYLTSTLADDYDSVQLSYPGPASPLAMSKNPSLFFYQSNVFGDQAAMDAEFPFGTYTFDATNISGTDTATFDYGFDAYPESLPYLTGSNFTDLQGMNSAAPFTFQLNPLVIGGQSNGAYLTLTVIDYVTFNFVFSAYGGPATTEIVLPANTLTPGRSFGFELSYFNNVNVPSSGAESPGSFSFSYQTGGTFFTAEAAAVPEPSTLVLAGIGGLALLGIARRRRVS